MVEFVEVEMKGCAVLALQADQMKVR
jgi:hypothetical protein